MTKFLLLFAALSLAMVFFPVGIVWTIGYSIRLRFFRKMVGYWAETARSSALVIDLLGNVLCRDLLNWACIQGSDRWNFGVYTETISEVLGRNKQRGTLTDAGRGLANLLNFIDHDHVERAAGYLPAGSGLRTVNQSARFSLPQSSRPGSNVNQPQADA